MNFYGKRYKLNDVNVRVFLALTTYGLWGEDGSKELSECARCAFKNILQENSGAVWDIVLQLAKEQAVVGLIAAAFEETDIDYLNAILTKPKRKALAVEVYSIEQANLLLDTFIAKEFPLLTAEGLTPVLLKGQGVARAYRNPQRRMPGDVDILLQSSDYEVAKKILCPQASRVMSEGMYEKQKQMFFDSITVELHGTMRINLTKKIDKEIDRLMDVMFSEKCFDAVVFQDSETSVLVPSVNIHVLYVFCHILHHFFQSGIGLRQVCDLARMLYIHCDEIDRIWLEEELSKLDFIDEWMAFGCMMVDYLGLPAEVLPMYRPNDKCRNKARLIMEYIMSVGNMGKNRDLSYRRRLTGLRKKTLTMWFVLHNALRIAVIFPRKMLNISFRGIKRGIVKTFDGQ